MQFILALCAILFSFIAAGKSSDFQQPTPTDTYQHQLFNRIDAEHVYDSIEWRKRIFYFKGRFGEKGLFDDDSFYFSDKGKHHPDLELKATLSAFLGKEIIEIRGKKQHPRCLFPARWAWIKKRLNINEKEILPVHCPDVDQFLKFTKYSNVSLVFTNYFIGNPASVFGHTLLRLGREETKGMNNSGLLDDAANFSAFIQNANPITYPIKGMFGFFEGRFALMPYYQKVQEYNNLERRDLWEYQLNLTQDEIDDLTLLLYELSLFKLDYWYLDDNCSFIILTLLDAVRPSLHLSDKFHLYAIPADTLKAVATKPELVKDVRFKPSSFARYIDRISGLNEKEKTLVENTILQNNTELKLPDDCNDECQSRVLDTVIDYIDFKEKVVGDRTAEIYKILRTTALTARAKNQVEARPFSHRPEKERPDFGHESSALGFQAGSSENGKFVGRFQWKPALHDLFDNDLGYSDQIQIAFLDHNFSYFEEKQKLIVDEVRFLELGSYPRAYPLHSPLSWKFLLATENNYLDFNRSGERFTKHYISWGFGKNYRFYDGRIFMYGLLNIEGGYSPNTRFLWFGGLAPEVALNFKFNDDLKFSMIYKHYQILGRDGDFDYGQGQLRLTYSKNVNHEVFLSSQYEMEALFTQLGYRFYY